ncbi:MULTISPECIES: MFS transporter [unclassified Sphingobium]|uniref:MFS transporter n=1 Tax=unclassified Sphingobium TaxID=2611147 RepID=UPI0007F3CD02|nr:MULTISPECIES: MFS transporter [unclassified Sphingobium]OAN59312.1 MFS transporter [Sphingobium sp. TCM1]WIW90091.1 MFS transporter [Sphingobium sp. V4]
MADCDPRAPASADQLPGMAYRSWFLFVMVLVSASVQGERYLMVVMVEPIRRELGLSDAAIGMAKDMIIAIVYILAIIPLARLADRWSKRKIVAIAATVWSAAVIVCGAAKSFWILLIGRAGIGLGEGGFTPPSQAWVADLFPIRQRATALSVFLLGASLGTFIGPAVGGWAVQEYGWRNTLIFASIPGFLLAPIVWFTLRDTRPGLADGAPARMEPPASFLQTARELMAIRTLPPLILAASLNALLTMGFISWAPAFVERTHGMPASQAGLQMGGALFFGSAIGHSIGGPLADFLGRRDLRWYVWMLMISGALATGIGWMILTGPSEVVFPLYGLNMLIGGLSAAPLMAVVAGLVPSRSRATAIALLMVSIQVLGLGGGPVLVGWLSDLLRPSYGEESLGMAMRWALLVGVPSTFLAWIASRHCREDFKVAGGWDGPAPKLAMH